MRVVYYTHPAFLAPALHLVQCLSESAEVHLLVEVSPGAWRSGLLDSPPLQLTPGLVPAAPVLGRVLPPAVAAYWRNLASFNLAVHTTRRAVEPGSWRTSQQVTCYLERLAPDVIHFESTPRRLVPNLLLGLRRAPRVLSVHDPRLHTGEANWRTELTRRLTYGGMRHFILHSKALRSDFCHAYGLAPDRVSSVPLGVLAIQRAWHTEPVRQDRRGVLFFGRLSPYKGLEVLLAAATSVAERVPGLRVVIAGLPVPGYRLPSLPSLPKGGTIRLVQEYVSNAELARLFQAAAVVACPYTDATQSGVLLTAYAFERPVVTTAVGGLPEYVAPGRTGLVVPPNEPRAFADALVDVLGDPGWSARIRQGVADLAAGRLSWRRAAHETLAVYRRVLRQ